MTIKKAIAAVAKTVKQAVATAVTTVEDVKRMLAEAGEPDATVEVKGGELEWHLAPRGGELHPQSLTGNTEWPIGPRASEILKQNMKSMCREQRDDASGASDDTDVQVLTDETAASPSACFRWLDHVRDLPERAGVKSDPFLLEPDTIACFIDADGRRMRVIRVDGAWAKQQASTK